MSLPWWGKERATETVSTIVGGPLGRCPRLTDETAGRVKNEMHGRRPTFTPLWAGPPDSRNVDAGDALVQLFSELSAPVLRRLNRLPDKSLIEYLRLAGIIPSPALPAEAIVRFTVSPAARRSVLVPKGFQVGARAADGSGDLVVFETQASLYATSAQIKEVYVQEGSAPRDVTTENDDPETTFRPLGPKPRVGDALLVGLEAEEGPAPDLSLGIGVAAAPGAPPPVAYGGTAPAPVLAAPMLEWAALTASGFTPVEVLGDETRNLGRSGVVELRLPRRWSALRPAGLDGDQLLYWLRLRVIQGEFDEPPQFSFIQLNMTRVKAVQTYRNEVLEPVDNGDDVTRRMRVRHTPVVPGSLAIEVDTTAVSEELDPQRGEAQVTPTTRWEEVDELLSQPPEARVFTLDPAEGVVEFGDGTEHGASIPPGFRNVRAVSYEVGGGAAGAVDADEITTSAFGVFCHRSDQSAARKRWNRSGESVERSQVRPRNHPRPRARRDGGRLRPAGPSSVGRARRPCPRFVRVPSRVSRFAHARCGGCPDRPATGRCKHRAPDTHRAGSARRRTPPVQGGCASRR